MKKFLVLSTLLVCSLFSATTIFAETLTVSSDSGAPGTTVTLQVTLGGNTAGVAGASFTLDYDRTNLSLTAIRSSFFPTFTTQNITPATIAVETASGTVTYEKALVVNDSGTMVAAARATNGPTGNQTLFELDFQIAGNAIVGASFPVQIVPSSIHNQDAGYNTAATIPMLVGIDGSSYPQRSVTLPTTSGSITVASGMVDQDNDGIDDRWETTHFGNTTTVNATSDYDRDGYSDLVEYLNGAAATNDPAGASFDPTVRNAPGGEGYDTATARKAPYDFNGDVTSDILVRNSGTGLTYIYNVNDSRVATYNQIGTFPAAEWEVAGVGDFNGDGSADILTRNIGNGLTYIYNVSNSAITSYNLIATFPATWKFGGSGDFNGDGTADILIRNTGNGSTYIYNVTNSAVSSYRRIASFSSSWEFAGVGDFNSDGSADILTRNKSNGRTYIYTVSNSRITSYRQIATFSTSWELAEVGDYNGDNSADFLARNTGNGRTYIYNVSNSRITAYANIATFPSTWTFE